MSFPFYKQLDMMDCGPTCLRMIAKHYGKSFALQDLREKCLIDREGVSLLGISEAAEQIGLRTLGAKIGFDQLQNEVILPCIVHWQQNHFIVVWKIKNQKVFVADPSKGLITYSKQEFIKGWLSASKRTQSDKGIVLMLETTAKFHQTEPEQRGLSVNNISHYFLKQKKLIIQLFFGLGAGMILQLILPFFTQSIVDVGIASKDIQFINLILIGQLMLFAGSTAIEFIRSWILLHISTRINLSLLSDYLVKLMKLPLSFFDSKKTGDILQRMNDHKRIESFLTGSTINIAFSLLNFVVFTCVIVLYDVTIFLVFLTGSTLYFLWVFLFLKVRRSLDFRRFDLSASSQSATIQLIQGMQEIKLSNSEKLRRWEWQRIQAKLFKLNVRTLALNQFQQGGAFFINQSKNVFVTFLSAKAVVSGELTFGGMLAIQYIIGQLNSPVQQFIQFIQSYQDAKISLERINEIHGMEEEEPADQSFIRMLPQDRSIRISNLSYRYPGYDNPLVLDNIDLLIPQGKITAVVGMSGSGKTTLLKLLLRFYKLSGGQIKVGNVNFDSLSAAFWRKSCGIVMQEGFIFTDTIANNIAVGEEYPDQERLLHAGHVANIIEFIDSLPLGFNTVIGSEGVGISQGQKQRILIARAVYKNPEYIFFDEATNALDANNERVIMDNLEEFFKGRTVLIVAHRLSTVKNADRIIVLEKGRVSEVGTHAELIEKEGDYFKLIRNQLQLGN